MGGHAAQKLPTKPEDKGMFRLAQLDGVLRQGLEDGLEIEGDRPITLRSSLVAVCCSRATLSSAFRACTSSNRPTLLMAIAAWSANVSTSEICLSVNGLTASL